MELGAVPQHARARGRTPTRRPSALVLADVQRPPRVAPGHRVHAVQRQGGGRQQGVGAGEADVAGGRAGRKRRDAGRVERAVGGDVGVVGKVVLVVVKVVVDVGGVDLEREGGGGGAFD